MKIVLTGSLGHIGKPLAQQLLSGKHQLTIITSKTNKKEEIELLGAIAAIGQLEDVEFLSAAFAGADLVYCMVPPNYSAPDLVVYYQEIAANYAEAIRRSGVKRIIYLSSYGAELESHTGPILGAHHAENILGALEDVSITFMRPGYFFYNLESYIPMIQHSGAISVNYGGDYKLPLVAPADIATAIAEEIEQTATKRKIRYVASDELSTNEIAVILGAAINKVDLRWNVISDEQRLAALLQNGVPLKMATYLTEMGATQHSGALSKEYFLNRPAVLGSTKLTEYAPAFAAAFTSAGKK